MTPEGSPNRLILYARWPSPGLCKTRLGREIGLAEATGVYARLLYGTVCKLVGADLAVQIELSLASKADVPYFAAAFPECTVRTQPEGDLGMRMLNSFRSAFAEGAQQVVLTGSDIPELGPALVRQSLEALESAPIALGPARDGGYYLVAMRYPGADIFQGIAWSSPLVLEQSLERAAYLRQQVILLPELSDLDDRSDYVAWQRKVISPSRKLQASR